VEDNTGTAAATTPADAPERQQAVAHSSRGFSSGGPPMGDSLLWCAVV
jgi:hypothetical protein